MGTTLGRGGLAVLGASLLWLGGPAQAAGSAYSCPSPLDPDVPPPAGWWDGTRPSGPAGGRKADRGKLAEIWLVAGRRGEERVAAPAILAPDGPDGGWDLSAERDGVLLVCLYGGTSRYLARSIAVGTARCRPEPQNRRGAGQPRAIACR